MPLINAYFSFFKSLRWGWLVNSRLVELRTEREPSEGRDTCPWSWPAPWSADTGLGLCCTVDARTAGHGEEGVCVWLSGGEWKPSASSLSWALRPWLPYPCLPTADRVSLRVRECRRIKGLVCLLPTFMGKQGRRGAGVQGPLPSSQLAAVCSAGAHHSSRCRDGWALTWPCSSSWSLFVTRRVCVCLLFLD